MAAVRQLALSYKVLGEHVAQAMQDAPDDTKLKEFVIRLQDAGLLDLRTHELMTSLEEVIHDVECDRTTTDDVLVDVAVAILLVGFDYEGWSEEVRDAADAILQDPVPADLLTVRIPVEAQEYKLRHNLQELLSSRQRLTDLLAEVDHHGPTSLEASIAAVDTVSILAGKKWKPHIRARALLVASTVRCSPVPLEWGRSEAESPQSPVRRRYNPSDLDVSPDIRELFPFIESYEPQDIELETPLKPPPLATPLALGNPNSCLNIKGPNANEDEDENEDLSRWPSMSLLDICPSEPTATPPLTPRKLHAPRRTPPRVLIPPLELGCVLHAHEEESPLPRVATGLKERDDTTEEKKRSKKSEKRSSSRKNSTSSTVGRHRHRSSSHLNHESPNGPQADIALANFRSRGGIPDTDRARHRRGGSALYLIAEHENENEEEESHHS